MTESRAASTAPDRQHTRLEEERARQRALADALAAELASLDAAGDGADAPADDGFGEGTPTPVDRDRDRLLLEQALGQIDEIDRALERMASGRYGACEVCGEPIGAERLEAVPTATLCVACKAGGLSARRRGRRRHPRRRAA